MFKRKLQALSFHSPEQTFQEEKDFRNLVCWLEDRQINHYVSEDRIGLRNICAGDWETSFAKYLKDLSCPIDPTDKNERLKIIDWLLSLAVRLQYGSKKQKNSSFYGSVGTTENPLEKMDFSSDEFKTGVMSLGKLLQIAPHPDAQVVLKAVCLLVKEKLSKEALDRVKKNDPAKVADVISLVDIDLGFETPDLISQDVGKILRLIYLKEVRGMQDIANEAIVSIQSITANPKTDTKLGKVGT